MWLQSILFLALQDLVILHMLHHLGAEPSTLQCSVCAVQC